MEVADVKSPDALVGDLVVADVAVVPADALVAPGAERLVARPGEDDRRDLDVVPGPGEGVAQLGQGGGRKALWTSGRLIEIFAIESPRS